MTTQTQKPPTIKSKEIEKTRYQNKHLQEKLKENVNDNKRHSNDIEETQDNYPMCGGGVLNVGGYGLVCDFCLKGCECDPSQKIYIEL